MTTALDIASEATDPTLDAHPDYRQREPLQIAMSLRTLMSRQTRLTVEFGAREILAHLLDVDSRNGRFIFEYGNIDADNQALLDSALLTFRSLPGALHTHFKAGPAKAVWFDDLPAFEASFPTELFYVQRREHFRVETPIGEPFVALGPFIESESVRLEIQDLSLGGVALRAYEARFTELEIGSVLHDVALQLGDFGSLSVNLEVISPRRSANEKGEERYVISCRFVERSAVVERVLQRVINRLENKRKTS